MKDLSAAARIVHPRWKVLLWEKHSIEPAMLRVPIVIIVFIFLWGISLYILEKTRVDYAFVLSTRTGPFAFIFSTAVFLCTLYAMHMTLFATSLGLTIETAIGLFYLLIACVLCIPRIPFAESMNHIWRLLRLCFFPGATISFSEVLLADALTSMSKVFKDFGVTMVAVYCYANGRNILDFHNHAMILIAVLASLPYWLRVRQCTVQLSSCPDYIARIPVYLNILKYFSAFPPIWLTAYASLGYTMHDLPHITAYLAAINTIYSFLWDVIMDWGLLQFTRDGRVLARSRLLLPTLTYLLVTVLNLGLRFSWLINRVPGMDQLHSSVIVLIIELGEVFRRAMWAVYRIEWEVIVQQDKVLEKDPILAEKLRTKYTTSKSPNLTPTATGIAPRPSISISNSSASD